MESTCAPSPSSSSSPFPNLQTMADKPSRGLVLYGDGLMRTVTSAHTNLHSLASRASCGFLSLSQYHHSENKDDRLVREFAELVDTRESYLQQRGGRDGDSALSTPTIGERFMGMRVAIITNNSCLQAFGNNVGLTSLPFADLIKKNLSGVDSPPVDIIASDVLKLLGFQDGKTLESSQFDLVFMHIGAEEDLTPQVDATVEYLDDLVGEILRIAPCGSEIASRLHFSVVMSYGHVTKDDDPTFSFLKNEFETGSDLSLLYPRQSYTVKGGNQRCDIRYYCPMLSAQVQDAVTRIDKAKMFSFEEFKEHCENLTIPADRFLHEIAFKLWKAPKYGA